jgi:hypothetical protein
MLIQFFGESFDLRCLMIHSFLKLVKHVHHGLVVCLDSSVLFSEALNIIFQGANLGDKSKQLILAVGFPNFRERGFSLKDWLLR